MNKELQFIKVMLVIISLLLMVQIAGPIWQPQAQAKNATVQDVNLVQIDGKNILISPYAYSPYKGVALPVKITE